MLRYAAVVIAVSLVLLAEVQLAAEGLPHRGDIEGIASTRRLAVDSVRELVMGALTFEAQEGRRPPTGQPSTETRRVYGLPFDHVKTKRQQKTQKGHSAAEEELIASDGSFSSSCLEQIPCFFPKPLSTVLGDDSAASLSMWGDRLLRTVLGRTAGVWLLQHIAQSKTEQKVCEGERRRSDDRSSAVSANDCYPTEEYSEQQTVSWLDIDVFLGELMLDADGTTERRRLEALRGSLDVGDDVDLGGGLKINEHKESFLRFMATSAKKRPIGGVSEDEWDQQARSILRFSRSKNLTTILRDLDGRSRDIYRLARELEVDVFGGAAVGASLYHTPRAGTTSTVPPHIDVMDVVVLQLRGEKWWSLRPAAQEHTKPPDSVALPLRAGHYSRQLVASGPLPLHNGVNVAPGCDAVIKEEEEESTMPLIGIEQSGRAYRVLLRPGDVLYVPRGYIHNTSNSNDLSQAHASTEQSSIHLSLGVEFTPRHTLVSYLSHLLRRSDASSAGSGDVLEEAMPADCFSRMTSAPSSSRGGAVKTKISATNLLVLQALASRLPELRSAVVHGRAVRPSCMQLRKAAILLHSRLRERFPVTCSGGVDASVKMEDEGEKRRLKDVGYSAFDTAFLAAHLDLWHYEPSITSPKAAAVSDGRQSVDAARCLELFAASPVAAAARGDDATSSLLLLSVVANAIKRIVALLAAIIDDGECGADGGDFVEYVKVQREALHQERQGFHEWMLLNERLAS